MEPVRGDYFMGTKKREYTIDDIFALPDGQRAELFDGEMVMMATPTITHQSILVELLFQIELYVRSKKGKCKVLPAPFGVFIKKDRKNYVEPDIGVVCEREKLDNKGCHGAPDWVIEIVSPGSRNLDYERKLALYRETGVREYWIVDSARQAIVVYSLEQSEISVVHPFGDEVKVGIYDDLIIDSGALAAIHFD